MEEGTAESKGYNFIFQKLVQYDEDVLGIIAYSVYKKQKIEYLTSIRQKQGREPLASELESFHSLSNSPTQIETYQARALSLIRTFTDDAIVEEAKEVSDYYAEKSRQEVAKLKPRFWLGVGQSVVGSAAFVLLLGVLVIFTWSLNQGPRQIIEHIFDVQITVR
ncbi:hypothetical protein [Pseudomonas abieticivorans]|uniref:hypothetical protein n=1 Tax=Pseudomonas abieticivorans TaxID=2931382 RepID=UPI0020BE5A40|nr:hypothetical protein [Pseudomonas sp. PIA16]